MLLWSMRGLPRLAWGCPSSMDQVGSWATASELDRKLVCPAASVLPVDEGTRGEGALWGTSMHHWKATGELFEGLTERGRGKKYRPRVDVLRDNSLPREVLWPGGEHEVSYVHGSVSGRSSPHVNNVGRVLGYLDRESLPRTTTKGTCDWETSLGPAALWQDDLKTGRMEWERAKPSERAQLLFYAYCGALWHGLPRSEDVMVSVTHWPKYPRENPPTRVTELIPVDRLLRFGTQLEEARQLAAKPGAADLTVPGEHCTFCKSKNYCKEFN